MVGMDERRVRTKEEQEMLDELITEGEGKEESYLSLEKHRNGLFRDFLEDYVEYMSIFRSETFNREKLELFITEGIRQLLKNDQPEFAMELVKLGKECSALSGDAVSEIVKYLSWKDEKRLYPIVSALLRI